MSLPGAVYNDDLNYQFELISALLCISIKGFPSLKYAKSSYDLRLKIPLFLLYVMLW